MDPLLPIFFFRVHSWTAGVADAQKQGPRPMISGLSFVLLPSFFHLLLATTRHAPHSHQTQG